MIRRTFDEERDLVSHEQIGIAMRLPRERVRQIEQQALVKIRIGFALTELLGRARADVVFEGLRGRGLREWRDALHRAAAGKRGRP